MLRPSDANQTAKLVAAMADRKGITRDAIVGAARQLERDALAG